MFVEFSRRVTPSLYSLRLRASFGLDFSDSCLTVSVFCKANWESLEVLIYEWRPNVLEAEHPELAFKTLWSQWSLGGRFLGSISEHELLFQTAAGNLGSIGAKAVLKLQKPKCRGQELGAQKNAVNKSCLLGKSPILLKMPSLSICFFSGLVDFLWLVGISLSNSKLEISKNPSPYWKYSAELTK